MNDCENHEIFLFKTFAMHDNYFDNELHIPTVVAMSGPHHPPLAPFHPIVNLHGRQNVQPADISQ